MKISEYKEKIQLVWADIKIDNIKKHIQTTTQIISDRFNEKLESYWVKNAYVVNESIVKLITKDGYEFSIKLIKYDRIEIILGNSDSSIPNLDVNFILSETYWTNKDVTVHIEWPEWTKNGDYIKEVLVDNVKSEDINNIIVTKNNTEIKAITIDKDGNQKLAIKIIENIDKDAPKIKEDSIITNTDTTCKIELEVEDSSGINPTTVTKNNIAIEIKYPDSLIINIQTIELDGNKLIIVLDVNIWGSFSLKIHSEIKDNAGNDIEAYTKEIVFGLKGKFLKNDIKSINNIGTPIYEGVLESSIDGLLTTGLSFQGYYPVIEYIFNSSTEMSKIYLLISNGASYNKFINYSVKIESKIDNKWVTIGTDSGRKKGHLNLEMPITKGNYDNLKVSISTLGMWTGIYEISYD